MIALDVNVQCLQMLTVTPKSGDVALQMAPMLAVANIASTVSMQFGKYPNILCNIIITNYYYMAWHSGRTSVSGRRTFPVLRSTCS